MPYWGPYYQGILLFGGLKFEVPYFEFSSPPISSAKAEAQTRLTKQLLSEIRRSALGGLQGYRVFGLRV